MQTNRCVSLHEKIVKPKEYLLASGNKIDHGAHISFENAPLQFAYGVHREDC